MQASLTLTRHYRRPAEGCTGKSIAPKSGHSADQYISVPVISFTGQALKRSSRVGAASQHPDFLHRHGRVESKENRGISQACARSPQNAQLREKKGAPTEMGLNLRIAKFAASNSLACLYHWRSLSPAILPFWRM